MMVSKPKRKGYQLEAQTVNLMNAKVGRSKWTRIPGSGAMGTSLGEPLLTADVVGKIESLPKKIKVECKSGYNNSTGKEVQQFTLKKEWLDKVAQEAQADYSLPILVGKFDNAYSGVKLFVALDIENFIWLLNYITDLRSELDTMYAKNTQ